MTDPFAQERPTGDNVIAWPFRATSVVANARRDCETLQRSVATLQRCLGALGDFLRNFDDRPEAEGLRAHMAELNELLSLRLAQISRTECLLEELLRRG
ncbi:hypothetical protein KUL72_36000 [Bradyrhizobium arachidis]|uniref:hypothetical protein n=1 Tax=Bradyrhizobium TaxID=374 RepID=UPI00216376D2|nr:MULTISPECIES: hypothetical protein [Bradyrhizobium]MDN4985638.1 hypothetical protein [Bradyrhizobium sp. WYCCWR 13022]UVO36599.1 hypothetical protein KUL72_36000 [Bradyrhizobium arachidis]